MADYLKKSARVYVRTLPTTKPSNDGNFQKRLEVQAEINSAKITVDRKCFQKTESEKEDLKLAKKHHKEFLKKSA